MAPAAMIIGGGLGLAAVGTFASIKAQKKQAKFQKQAAQAQRSQDNLRAARERREAIRAARIARGTLQQAAVSQGAENTSASLGGLGSIESQLRGNLSFLDQYNTLSDQAGVALSKANAAGAKAGMWGQVAQFGMTIAQNASGIQNAVFKGG